MTLRGLGMSPMLMLLQMQLHLKILRMFKSDPVVKIIQYWR